MTIRDSAAYCGISYSSIVNWKRRGQASEEPYATFLRDIEKAKVTLKHLAHDQFFNLLKRGHWPAIEFAHKYYEPERFAQRQDVRVTGWIGMGLSQLKQEGLEPDEIREVAKHLEPLIGTDGVEELLAAAGLGQLSPPSLDTQSPADQEGQDEELPV